MKKSDQEWAEAMAYRDPLTPPARPPVGVIKGLGTLVELAVYGAMVAFSIAVPLGLLYLLIRFVKWARADWGRGLQNAIESEFAPRSAAGAEFNYLGAPRTDRA